jgi:hypothetical protein
MATFGELNGTEVILKDRQSLNLPNNPPSSAKQSAKKSAKQFAKLHRSPTQWQTSREIEEVKQGEKWVPAAVDIAKST